MTYGSIDRSSPTDSLAMGRPGSNRPAGSGVQTLGKITT
jgi:hypothetical protein